MSPHIPVQISSCNFVAVCEGAGSQLECSQFCCGETSVCVCECVCVCVCACACACACVCVCVCSIGQTEHWLHRCQLHCGSLQSLLVLTCWEKGGTVIKWISTISWFSMLQSPPLSCLQHLQLPSFPSTYRFLHHTTGGCSG